MGTPYVSGGTNTGEAIQFVRQNSFLSKYGSRSSASKMIILITDGKSNNMQLTTQQAMAARNQGITIFAIGVGSGIDRHELNGIATDPDSQHVFTVNNFDALTQIKGELEQKACQGRHKNISYNNIT